MPGIDVAAGAAARDQDLHARLPRPALARERLVARSFADAHPVEQPAAARFASSAEPPYETNGSGSPVVGASPVATAQVDERVEPELHREPGREQEARTDRRRAPRRAGRATRGARAAPSSTVDAEEAQLLGQDREDEVGVRLGQEQVLLQPAAEPAAEPAARADRDQRLVELPARAARVELAREQEADERLRRAPS